MTSSRGGVGGASGHLMSANRACIMRAIDILRSDSSSIALPLPFFPAIQGENFSQILTLGKCQGLTSEALHVGLHMFWPTFILLILCPNATN